MNNEILANGATIAFCNDKLPFKEIKVRLTWRGIYLKTAEREMAFATSFIGQFLDHVVNIRLLESSDYIDSKKEHELLDVSIKNAFNVEQESALTLIKVIHHLYNDEESKFCQALKTMQGFPEYHFVAKLPTIQKDKLCKTTTD